MASAPHCAPYCKLSCGVLHSTCAHLVGLDPPPPPPPPRLLRSCRGKAMAGKSGDLLALVRDVLLTARLDDKARFTQVC